MREFEDREGRGSGVTPRVAAAVAWFLFLSAPTAGQEPAQERRESVAVPAATFQWTGNPGADRASVNTECATADVPVAKCDEAYEGLACVFVELERAIRRRGQIMMVNRVDPGLRSERLTAGGGDGPWTMEVEGDRLDTFPFIDFDEDVVGVFVNGEFLQCREGSRR